MVYNFGPILGFFPTLLPFVFHSTLLIAGVTEVPDMIRFITLAALIVAISFPADAQTRKFPYEAVITENETYVRSGPGTRYYPTSRLAQGNKVMVHRHDPGGWYMIAPPSGSFSWIRADYVQPKDQNSGVVTENQVVVRVGSSFGDKRDVEQKRLSRGDTVQIMGEKTITTPEGSVRMFQIAPPRGEYRWVPGQFVAAADSIARQPVKQGNPFEEFAPVEDQNVAKQPKLEPDPFADPKPSVGDKPQVNRPVVSELKNNPGVVRSDQPDATETEAARLAELDQQFRTVVRLKTSQWDFRQLEAGYQELANNASTDALKNQLDQRFAALAKYQKIKDQYDDFLRLTKETAARDAQILSSSGQRPAILSKPPTRETPAPGASQDSGATGDRKIVGAGIIQEAVVAAPNGPKFVLISPKGQVLSFLGSSTVDLSRYLGRSLGLYGKRSFRTDLQTDYIEVESVTPVRLKR